MGTAIKKLRAYTGASAVLAIVVFFVIVILCTAIVTIGMSNAKSAQAGQASEQDYLTVKSAASLVRASVEADVSVDKAYDAYATVSDGAALALFKNMVTAKNLGSSAGLTQSMTVEVSVPATPNEAQAAAADKLKQVAVTFSMSELAGDYDVTALFAAGDGFITMRLAAAEDEAGQLTWIAKSAG